MTKAIQGLTQGVGYGIKVVQSEWSVPVIGYLPTRPSGPASVTASGTALTESIVLSWTAPTMHADGTALRQGELLYYFVYYAQAPGIDITNPATYTDRVKVDAERYTFPVPDPAAYLGPFYFVVTAVDTEALESAASSEVGPVTASAQTTGPSSVDDWAAGNVESVLVGRGRIGLVFRLPKTTWNAFAYYKVYYDVDTGGGFTGAWTYLSSERIGFMHAPITQTWAYKYKVTVVGEDGTETAGSTHDNAGIGYTPNEADQSNILADVVMAGTIIATDDLIARTFVGGAIQSTTLGTATGTLISLDSEYLKFGGSDVSYNSGNGFFAGLHSGAYKLFVGRASGNKLLVDSGAGTVAITGSVTITAGSGIGNLSDAGDLATLDVVGNARITDISFSKLTAGTNTASLVIGAAGYIKSNGYVAGSTGFKIDGAGNAEFNNVTVRGIISAQAGSQVPWSYVTGVAISADDLYIDNDVSFAADGTRHSIKGLQDLYFSATKSTLYPYISMSAGQLELNSGSSSGNDVRLVAADTVAVVAGNDVTVAAGGDITMSPGAASTEAVTGCFKYVGSKVYDGTPTAMAWTNLGLSTYVGARRALVFLRIENNGGVDCSYRFRPDGSSYQQGDSVADYPGLFSCRCDTTYESGYAMCYTSTAGIIEWCAGSAVSTEVWVLFYIA